MHSVEIIIDHWILVFLLLLEILADHKLYAGVKW